MRASTLAACGLTILAVGPVRAAPYPRSSVVAGITWNTATYQFGGVGGDIWPVTWGADGQVHTAWGDGTGGCLAKVSYGTAAIAGGPSATLTTTGCGPLGMGRGKIGSLLDAGGVLYAVVNLQNRAWPYPDFAIWSSPDGG